MADDTLDPADDTFSGTIELVSAYVANSNNRLAPDELQTLIRDTFATLSSLTGGGLALAEEAEDHTKSRAEIKKSIGATHITSFVDGKGYRSLKRHLTTNGYTPESYRATFGLGSDYPMVHPQYAAQRSELAKSMGLGQGGRKPKATAGKKTRARAKAAE
jgi:predicted transcriptional regulator